ncbi:MAG: aldehyde dehydrogenase family protein [Phycisphaerales bacterium]|nr:MAG: aldehyde dehydrogenase family protein [Phycisphaerales bacterium]
MLKDTYPYYLAGEAVFANTDLPVTNKYTGVVAAKVAMADAAVIDRAIGRAAEAFDELRRWPAHRRKAVLQHVVDQMGRRFEEMAHALCIEAGKPIRDSRGEVTRGIDTFTIAVEESTRMCGETMPLDISPRAEGYEAIIKRFPIGPCSFITPFNFPINLAAHKIAPALAVGCPFVLKPASSTPIGAIILGEILAETDLPKGAFSVLPCPGCDADPFVVDDRLKKISFTGSPEVGWDIKARAGKKKVTLELGGNAACIVDRDADLDYASDRIILGAFYQSGQSCVSVQRILGHRDIYDELRDSLVEKTARLRAGDPLDEQTFIGPLITEGDAKRVEEWVKEARQAGGRILVGGNRNGALFDATLIENAPHEARVNCREIFGPVATLEPFDDIDQAIRIANDSAYGLQAGIFTRDLHHAFRAYNEIEVGGVLVNDIPSMRVDSMPYGGVKDSGLGREGVRFAMEEMTELRAMVLNRVGG